MFSKRGQVSALTSSLGALPRLLPAALIIALLACVLVPLPTLVVDVLLSLSLSGAVLLLVGSLTVRRSAEFLSFPSLLLLTTLYRLALNIQTTRLILADADAGEVIDSFASLVVRDELIVGAVMFGIITAVQFLVITRGSERVAEVAARFALDGLPGHQAAIDADRRSGAISVREAERRRARLVEHTSFYGAMDGAVRFVKGDAVAGLSITTINILGGLLIGWKHGMPLQEILETYGRLAIGDGLLAQIPAVLVSLAAGVLVARVDRQGHPEELQTPSPWFEPGAVLVPVALLVALALVPGMPQAAFAVTAIGLLCVGGWIAYQQREPGSLEAAAASESGRQVLVMLPSKHDRSMRKRLETAHSACERLLNVSLPPLKLTHVAAPGVQICFEQRILADRPDIDPADLDSVSVVTHRALVDSAGALIDLQDVEGWVEEVARVRPAIARRGLEIIQLDDLLALVRGFLRDRVGVPPMGALLSMIVEQRLFRDENARSRWLELARVHLASYWLRPALAQLTKAGAPRWLRPLPDAEEELCAAIVRGAGGVRLGLSAAERSEWCAALFNDKDGQRVDNVVVLTRSMEAREAFALLLRDERHALVLKVAELGRAGLDEPRDVRWVAAPVEPQ